MCKRFQVKFIFSLLFLCFSVFKFSNFAFCENFYDVENDFSINFIDTFYVSEKAESSWYFESDILPIEFALNVYKEGRFSSPKDAISYCAKQIKATSCDVDNVKYRDYECYIASVQFEMSNIDCTGWVLSIKLRNSKIINFLGFTAKENGAIYETMILSCLDSICVDRASYLCPGPVTCYACPKEGLVKKKIDFEGSKYSVNFDKIDSDAASYLIDREYKILKLLSSTDYWFSSWQRFYQMVYRDSYGRIKDACFDFCSSLYEKSLDNENPEFFYASKVLKFVQNLPYGRNKTENDFTNLVSTVLGTESDCDSRSVLCAIMLDMMNIKSTLFVSVDYSHALVGAKLNSNGAKLLVGQDWYLLGETTAKVDFGKVAQSMSDSSKWLNIKLFY